MWNTNIADAPRDETHILVDTGYPGVTTVFYDAKDGWSLVNAGFKSIDCTVNEGDIIAWMPIPERISGKR